MSKLTEALEKIMVWLQLYKPECAESFQSGLTRTAIQNILGELAFQLPEEFYELYQWRNGNMRKASSVVFPPLGFLPLEEALEIHLALIKRASIGVEHLVYGSKSTFPFVEDNGNYLSVVFTEKHQQTSSVLDSSEGFESRILFSSITSLMQMLAECCQTGAYYVNQEGFIEANDEYATQIFHKYNPEIGEILLVKIQDLLSPEVGLSQKSIEIVGELLENIASLRYTEATESLVKFLELKMVEDSKQSKHICTLIIQTLGKLGDTRAVESLIFSLRDSTWQIRRDAAKALRQIGDDRAVEALIEVLQDNKPDVRNMARQTLLYLANVVAKPS